MRIIRRSAVLISLALVVVGVAPAAIAGGYEQGTSSNCGANYTAKTFSRTVFETNVWPPHTNYSYYYGHTWFSKATWADTPRTPSGTWLVDAYNTNGDVDEANTYTSCRVSGS